LSHSLNIPANNDLKQKLGFSEYSPALKVSEVAAKCSQYGLAAFQISGDYSINFPENVNKDDCQAVANFNRSNNITLHFHAPGDIPMASRHQAIRYGGIDRLKEFIALAIDLGARSFIFHPGRFAFYKISTDKLVMAHKNIPEEYYKRFLDSALRIVDYAEGRIELLLENTYSFTDPVIKVIDKFLESPSTGLVWDIGHMVQQNKISSQNQSNDNSTGEFFSARLAHIKLAHLHDISGKRGHLALGTGILDIASFVDIIGKLNIQMIIEVLSDKDLQTSLKYLESLTIKRQ